MGDFPADGRYRLADWCTFTGHPLPFAKIGNCRLPTGFRLPKVGESKPRGANVENRHRIPLSASLVTGIIQVTAVVGGSASFVSIGHLVNENNSLSETGSDTGGRAVMRATRVGAATIASGDGLIGRGSQPSGWYELPELRGVCLLDFSTIVPAGGSRQPQRRPRQVLKSSRSEVRTGPGHRLRYCSTFSRTGRGGSLFPKGISGCCPARSGKPESDCDPQTRSRRSQRDNFFLAIAVIGRDGRWCPGGCRSLSGQCRSGTRRVSVGYPGGKPGRKFSDRNSLCSIAKGDATTLEVGYRGWISGSFDHLFDLRPGYVVVVATWPDRVGRQLLVGQFDSGRGIGGCGIGGWATVAGAGWKISRFRFS